MFGHREQKFGALSSPCIDFPPPDASSHGSARLFCGSGRAVSQQGQSWPGAARSAPLGSAWLGSAQPRGAVTRGGSVAPGEEGVQSLWVLPAPLSAVVGAPGGLLGSRGAWSIPVSHLCVTSPCHIPVSHPCVTSLRHIPVSHPCVTSRFLTHPPKRDHGGRIRGGRGVPLPPPLPPAAPHPAGQL